MILALACATSLYCSSADAAEWVRVGTSDDGNVSLYVDKESIISVSKNMMRSWTKFFFEEPETFESKTFSQMRVHMEYDCSEKRSRMLELTFDYLEGSRETFNFEKEWSSVKSGTLQEQSYLYLCNK
jgi:hypothetical protein